MKIAVVLGTRPEAVKLAPVISAMRAHPHLEPLVISTGQHREMLTQTLRAFGIVPDVDLGLFRPGQSLEDLTARTLQAVSAALPRWAPAATLVQGDTTTTYAAALSSFYAGVPVVHLEAGLRTGDLRNPFPEEANRRMVTVLADLHLAATSGAVDNLRAEGVADEQVVLTGNTVIDALLRAVDLPSRLDPVLESFLDRPGRLLLVTVHRREAWASGVAGIAGAVGDLLASEPGLRVVVPLHRNPLVRGPLVAALGAHPRALLVEPLDYLDFVQVLRRSDLVLTDSGGVQEEAPSLGKPVLVARATTERPEGVAAGTAALVGTERAGVRAAVSRLLRDQDAFAQMAHAVNPYGDGRAAERVVAAIAARYAAGRADAEGPDAEGPDAKGPAAACPDAA